MALKLEEQLDRITGLAESSVGRVGRVAFRFLARLAIEDIGFDTFKLAMADLFESFADDGDDEGVDEYVESPIKKKARAKGEAAADKIYQWATR